MIAELLRSCEITVVLLCVMTKFIPCTSPEHGSAPSLSCLEKKILGKPQARPANHGSSKAIISPALLGLRSLSDVTFWRPAETIFPDTIFPRLHPHNATARLKVVGILCRFRSLLEGPLIEPCFNPTTLVLNSPDPYASVARRVAELPRKLHASQANPPPTFFFPFLPE